ncbi:MAG: hypothetical protein ACRD1G_17520, partial [Acidimicrobiales bacterium]
MAGVPPSAQAGPFGTGPPPLPPLVRLRTAYGQRAESDYIFNFWTALGWSVLTLGIFTFYVLYQLIRRMRDHNRRRLEVVDAARQVAWEAAGRRGLEEELRPAFERLAFHIETMRQMTAEFRDPVIWVVIAILVRGLVDLIAFILIDQDLVKQGQADHGAETELNTIYDRLGQPLVAPDPSLL